MQREHVLLAPSGLRQSNFNGDQMMDIRKILNLKMTNDKAQMSNQA